ncbi:MAG: hypothetical protein F6K24_43685 [Okeania sp. SIO2D1]|nr:hypothetical protein [Okeania sp. SIO2D1]
MYVTSLLPKIANDRDRVPALVTLPHPCMESGDYWPIVLSTIYSVSA